MSASSALHPSRWNLKEERKAILWDVEKDTRLPHKDHIEMSGRRVSVIVRYRVDENRNLTLSRKIFWPMLRVKPGDVRGYLIRTFGEDAEPQLTVNGTIHPLPPVEAVIIDGTLRFEQSERGGRFSLVRTLFPSADDTRVVEHWAVQNQSTEPINLSVTMPETNEVQTNGVYGNYAITTSLVDQDLQVSLASEETAGIWFSFAARLEQGPATSWQGEREQSKRLDRLAEARDVGLVLDTPDPVLNTAFAFAKFRATESIFDTAMGTVHSPGGGSYYGGIWANDQAEYSGPFFAFHRDEVARRAALTAYRIFARYTNPEYERLPSSLEVEGDFVMKEIGDRGDAAMIAYGAAHYALTCGEEAVAHELRSLVDWCLEYCHRRTNTDGVIESYTDELEGRFPTGTANLSTSALAYGGLRATAHLVRDLGDEPAAAEYDRRADALEEAIEQYFGGVVEGFETYRYYEGNETLRAWICLPLTMGIFRRAKGTVAALFSPRLWTPDGLATESGDKVFWDRATLYGLLGVFASGETEKGLRYLTAYSKRRLLGDHVPYPVEAYPEGSQAHMSAESALYCRIYLEGLFGITPTGLRRCTMLPRLPDGWDHMALRDVCAFGHIFDVVVRREAVGLRLTVTPMGAEPVMDVSLAHGQSCIVTFSTES